MSKENRKLGRGLSSLLGDLTFSDIEHYASGNINDYEKTSILEIPLEQVIINVNQPRKTFDNDLIEELAISIKENGILQPIIVKNVSESVYVIVAGERRYRAATMAGLKTIPCVVRSFNDTESYFIAMTENIQRSNLNPIEEAMGYKTMCENYNLSHVEIAKIVGKSRSHITNMINILSMPEDIHQMLIDGSISTGHAKVLKSIQSTKEQMELAQIIQNEGLSVRALEKHIKDISETPTQKNTTKENENSNKNKMVESEDLSSIPPEILKMEDLFNAHFTQMIHIQYNKSGSGKIVIEYDTLDELYEMMSKMIDLEEIYAK